MAADLCSKDAQIGRVPNSWTVAPLSFFVSRVTYGFTNPMPTTSEGPFMVTAKDIHHGRIDYTTARHTSWTAYRDDLTDKSRPRLNDILLTKDGSIGRVAICDREDVCINQSVAVIQPTERIDPRFLKYLLEAPYYQRKMEGDSDGTTIKHIYITRVDKMEIAVAPIAEQHAIVSFLGSIDDKIKLNRAMQETLEGTAQALFNSWFVDFDPVPAKAERSEPVLPRRIAQLFPDSFDSIGAPEIPKAWNVVGLDRIGRFLNGLALQKFPPQADRFLPVIKIAQLRTEDTSDADKASADLAPEYIVENGDVLFSWSGSLECVLWAGGKGALNQHLFKVTSDIYPKWFYYLWIHAHLPEFRRIASGKATTMGHIQRGHLSAAKVLVPPSDLLKEMDRFFAPLIGQIVNLKLESRTLRAIRDTLLPKLVSSELRIPDVERIVGGQL